jgi:hypothetical protein
MVWRGCLGGMFPSSIWVRSGPMRDGAVRVSSGDMRSTASPLRNAASGTVKSNGKTAEAGRRLAEGRINDL